MQEYVVGKGAPTLTIWVFQFGGASSSDSTELIDIQTRFLPQMQDIYEGYEWVFYLRPSKYVSVETFNSIKAWGVGRDQNRPAEYCGGAEICAYSSLPYEAIPLSELQNDTKVRHAKLLEKNHGRVRPEPIYADIILDTYELTSFFTQVGAYDHPVATPAAPPIPGENYPYTPGTNVGDPPSDDDATVTVPGGLDDTATDTPTAVPDAASIATADMQSYSCFYPYPGSCKGCYSGHNCRLQQ